MVTVTVLSRPGCHLCEVALATVRLVNLGQPFALEHVDVESDPDLEARYGARVPVILIDGTEVLSGRITDGQLRWALKRARWSRPVSRILSRLRKTLARG